MKNNGYVRYGGREPYYRQLIASHPPLPYAEMLSLIALAQGGDEESMRRVVESNYRLAAAMLERYFRAYLEYPHSQLSPDDLFVDAVCGVPRAVETFNPARARFSTYAATWIFQNVNRAIDTTGHTIYYPVWVWEKLRKEWRDSREGDFKDLVIASGLPRVTISLDEPWKDEEEGGSEESLATNFIDRLAQEGREDAEQKQFEIGANVSEALICLSERELNIINLYFGMNGSHSHTLREIGEMLGLTHESIRLIRDAALKKLARHAPELEIYCEG